MVWGRVFKLKNCQACGNYRATEAHLEYIRKTCNLPSGSLDVCPSCK